MRFFWIFAFCSWPALGQTNQESESNMSCVERLQMPVYPPLAAVARVEGLATITVVVASDGSVQTEVVGHPLLREAVERAVRASVFRKTCDGKSVRMIFHFVLDEDSPPVGQRVSFGYPNQFWISVRLRIIKTQA